MSFLLVGAAAIGVGAGVAKAISGSKQKRAATPPRSSWCVLHAGEVVGRGGAALGRGPEAGHADFYGHHFRLVNQERKSIQILEE